jgi:uncharacterized protein (TIGR02271 family)
MRPSTSTPPMERIATWPGRMVIDQDGNKIGKVQNIYQDTDTGRPEWLAISTSWFSGRTSFVPIERALEQGGEIVVPWDEATVKDAPTVEADGHLSPEEEDRLYRHYGHSAGMAPARRQTGTGAGDAMTRSEEELRVEKGVREAGRVRLRKWVDTEHVSQTVPVTREEIRIEREPITDANVGAATSGPAFKEDVHEEVLREEEVRVHKQEIPKERVRLAKDTVTEERQVDADLRKERIEVERSSDNPRR